MSSDLSQRASTDEHNTRTDPFPKTHYTILEREIEQAVQELRRSRMGLFLSGLIAGIGLGLSLLLVAVSLSRVASSLLEGAVPLLLASAYSVGFIAVIMGRTDLFTEYTTIAILPVLAGISPSRQLAWFWSLVYVSNMIGGAAIAGLIALVGPALGVIDPAVLETLAERLTEHPWWVILLSAMLAGWLMGLLSWLVSAGRDTVSQIIFIWLIAGAIGFCHLHHIITGTIEVLAALFAGQAIGGAAFGRFLLWTTVGNIAGGILFAVLIQYSVVIGGGNPMEDGGHRGSPAPDRSSARGRGGEAR